MTGNEFYCALDVLGILKDEITKTLETLTDLINEAFDIGADIGELIPQANREITQADGKVVFADLRVFAGFGDERLKKAREIVKKFSAADMIDNAGKL